MPKQQRMMRVEQQMSQLGGQMQQLESRSEEELESETRYRAAAQAILGARAAEKFDAKRARACFQKALAAAKPQERLQLRRMADAALAHAERRADDLKIAAERLGMEAPSSRALFGMKVLGLLWPAKTAGSLARARGVTLILLLIAAILFLAFGIVSGIAAAAGGLSLDLRIFWGLALVFVALVALFFFGRRRQRGMEAKRAEQLAAARRR